MIGWKGGKLDPVSPAGIRGSARDNAPGLIWGADGEQAPVRDNLPAVED
jgi:hypothetical protein